MDPIFRMALDPGLEVESCGVLVSAGCGRHPDRTLTSWEVIIVERGRLGIAVGTQVHDLRAGSWVLLPAGIRHYGTADYPRDLRFSWLHFRPRPGAGLALRSSGTVHDPAPLYALIRRLMDYRASPLASPQVESLHLALILAHLMTAPAHAPDSEVGELAARAMRIIRSRFREPRLTTSAVARILAVGSDHLGRSFRRSFGMTVVDAIQRCRLAEAKRLLALGSLRVDDAARASGFRDGQWLRRLLTRSEGIPPRTWRRMHARIHVNTI